MSERASVKGRELCTIRTTHTGEKAETTLTVQFSINDGDLKVLCDVDARHSTISIFIASADDTAVSSEEREYIEVELGKDGTSKIKGYLGNGVEISDKEGLSLETPLEIVQVSPNSRWQLCGLIPFFFLPSPGSVMDDECLLKWMINIASRDLLNNEILSLVRMEDNKSKDFNPHQIDKFQELIISDADAFRLRSRSRSSLSRVTISRSTQRKSSNIANFQRELARRPENVKKGRVDLASQSNPFQYCESAAQVTKALQKMYPLSPEEVMLSTGSVSEAFKESSDDLEISKNLLSILREDEEVLRAMRLWCRHGWNHKKVLLVLSADSVESRLHIFNRRTKKFIRTLPWSITKPITVNFLSEERFDLEFIDTVSTNSGSQEDLRITYHFLDQERAASYVESLVTSIQAISDVQDRYVRDKLGTGEHAALKATLRRTRRENIFEQYCTIT